MNYQDCRRCTSQKGVIKVESDEHYRGFSIRKHYFSPPTAEGWYISCVRLAEGGDDQTLDQIAGYMNPLSYTVSRANCMVHPHQDVISIGGEEQVWKDGEIVFKAAVDMFYDAFIRPKSE